MGQSIDTHVSDEYACFHCQLILATAAEAPHVLDGLLHHASSLEIHEHYTDTGGATDHVFAPWPAAPCPVGPASPF